MHSVIKHPKGIDWLWIAVLAILGIGSRLPFTSHILYHWDSINFTLAMSHYDIAHHQPQPPGYILYVMLARWVNLLVANPQWTLVGISIIGGTLASIFLYLLGRDMFNRRVGVAAALWLLFSPLFWFYSEIAMPYIIDGLAVISLAWLFYRAEHGKNTSFLPAAILLGLTGGFRQQTMVFMIPLAIYAMRKARLSQMILAGGVSFIVFLGSFIPMVLLSGGWQPYRQAVSQLSDTFFSKASIFLGGGWQGLAYNTYSWASSTAYSVSLIGILLLAWAIWKIRKFPTLIKIDRTWFLTIWILPSLAFYTFIRMGSHGLIFTYLPAVLLIAAKALSDLAEGTQGYWKAKTWASILGVILIADVLLFAVIPSHPIPGKDFKIVNWATIRENDRFFEVRFNLVHANFDPHKSVILATTWRHLQYYLPEYHVLSVLCVTNDLTMNNPEVVDAYGKEYYPLKTDDLDNTLSISIQNVIFFDQDAECLLAQLPQERIKTLSTGRESMYTLQLEPDEVLAYNGNNLVIHKR